MGRHPYSSRLTCEEAIPISTSFLNKHNYFKRKISGGDLKWSIGETQMAATDFVVSMIPGNEYVRFIYTYKNTNMEEREELDYIVKLVSTTCNYGGKRWWFICPLIVDNKICNRRVGGLYIARGKYFGCKHCHNLTYKSSQESHKYDRVLRKMGIDPKQANKMFKAPKRGYF